METRGGRDSGAQERPRSPWRPPARAQREAPTLRRGSSPSLGPTLHRQSSFTPAGPAHHPGWRGLGAMWPSCVIKEGPCEWSLEDGAGPVTATTGAPRCAGDRATPTPCSFPAWPDARPSRMRPALGISAPPTTPHSLNKGLLDRCTRSMNAAA